MRATPEGPVLGYESFAKQAGEKWPDTLVADDLTLTPVSPGVVYGTYRYSVRYGAEEHAGLSERLFLKTPKGWRIAVTSAWEAPPGTPPPPHAYTGATLVDGTGAPAVPNAVVVVRDGQDRLRRTRVRLPLPRGRPRDRREGLLDHPGPRRRTRPLLADGLGGRTAGRLRRPRDSPLRRDRARPARRIPSASSGRTSARASRPSSTSAATRGRSTFPRAPRTTPSRRTSRPPVRSSRPSTTGSPPRRTAVPLPQGRGGRARGRALSRVAGREGREGLVPRQAGPAR